MTFTSSIRPWLLSTSKGGSLELATQAGEIAWVGIMCHPHPLYQGTMDNKVVATVVRAWQKLGWHTVRFNYRGVGQSTGTYGHAEGEVEDLQTVIQWVQQVLPEAQIYLGGFSFGAYIAARGILPSYKGLLSVAPAVENQDYSKVMIPPTLAWDILMGEQDEIVSFEAVKTWSALQAKDHPQLQFHTLPEASHFFHGLLPWVSSTAQAAAERAMAL